MDAVLLDLIQKADRKEIWLRLLYYVRKKASIWPLPAGQDAEDIVSIAWERLISKKRKWDSQRKPDLLIHLKGIIRSILSKHGLRNRKKDLPLEQTVEGEACNEEMLYGDPRQDISPFDAELAWQALGEEIGDDGDLQNVVAAIKLGAEKPAEIAELAEIDVKRVYELQRKLDGYVHKASARFRTYELEGVPYDNDK